MSHNKTPVATNAHFNCRRKKKIKEEGKMVSTTIYFIEQMEAGIKSNTLQPFPWRNYSKYPIKISPGVLEAISFPTLCTHIHEVFLKEESGILNASEGFLSNFSDMCQMQILPKFF